MEIYTNKEKYDIINSVIEAGALTMNDLVQRVGDGVAQQVNTHFDPDRRVIIFAGWTLNGAYALATAHKLQSMGYKPEIYLFNIGGNRLSPECESARKRLLHDHPKCHLIEIVKSIDTPELDSDCIVVDGMYGGELDRPIPRSFGLLVRSINESGASIISIEIPSGLFAEWNANNGISRDIIHADITVAIESPCLAYFINENVPIVGEWHLLRLGIIDEAAHKSAYQLVDRAVVKRLLRKRPKVCSKADFGDALICAGSYGKMGAAILAARGCLRAGVGKLTCYGPRCGCSVMQAAEPCAMYAADTHEIDISRVSPAHTYSAYGIGPGIGVSDATVSAVEGFLKMSQAHNLLVMIDADAINCMARKPIILNYLPQGAVLTPHDGEFDRLFGEQLNTEARLHKAMEVTAYHGVVMVLKGYYTSIVHPDGTVSFNASGTPALATPGSGDVLTGVITSFMAQDYPSATAAAIGVFVHGMAGGLAEELHGSYGVMASDVADMVSVAIKKIME